MKRIILHSLTIFLVASSISLFAQQTTFYPTLVRQAIYSHVTPPLRDMKLLPPRKVKGDPDREVKNRIGMKEFNHLVTHPFTLPEDPVWQKQDGTYVPAILAPIQNFDGINNLLGYYPPDTQGDVGPDKYVQVVNCNFAVYSKTGALLLGPALLSSIWAGISPPYLGTNNGDPVVLYDQAAQRWIISEFSIPSASQNAELVAVSQTSDPTGAWYVYVFEFGNKMPDYPKFGVWPDGYYLSFNQFVNQSTWGGVGAVALERARMLTGDPTARMVYVDLGASSNPSNMLPSDWDGTTTPIANEPNYFTFFDDWSSATNDYLKIWQFHVDWITTANSTFSESYTLTTAPFKSSICTATRGRCIPQPGTTVKLESLSDRLMYRLQYRNFGGYRAMVTNHTVDVDGSGHAGVRWYELRNTGAAWSIYQQGTYAPDANHRWVGSVAMNSAGDIALGYSVSAASSVYPSIKYTGRRANDPLNQMTVAEQTIMTGTGSQTGSAARWGDYSMMSVDPADDLTFWFTTEYVQTTGSTTWRTRIASFKFSNNPVIATLAASGVSGTAATLNGTINPNGLASTYHFEWGTTTAYGNSTATTPAGSGSSNVAVTANLNGLLTATTYHFRLVGENSDGITTGNDMTVIPGAAGVSTTAASSITMTAATAGGNVLYDGGFTVSARGVCWGTSANPVVSGNHTTDGSGTGTFTSSITGLTANTTYHVRAYATSSSGTFYGDDLTFATLCGIYTLPFSENFPATSIPACWSQVDHQGNGQVWQFGVITGQSPNPSLTPNYAYLNSDAYGSGNSQNADLITPLLDLSAYATVNVQFKNYFLSYSGSSGSFSYSINGGTSWNVIQNFTLTSTTNPSTFTQAVNAAAGQSQVKFKWNYTGSFGYYWAIDEVQITGTPLPTLAVAPANQNVPKTAGATNFNVTSNSSWTATSSQAWCTVTSAGSGNGTIAANFTQNTTNLQRVAQITVTVSGLPAVVVTVTQAPALIVYGSFKYYNTALTPLDNVKVVVKLGTARIDSVITDANGNYGFISLPNGIYTVSAYTTKPWASVNATDAVKVERHFAGLEVITEPVKWLAADVNLSNSINGTDAIKIKRRFSGQDSYFDRGDWTFAKPTIGGDTIILSGSVVNQDFYGLCVGDVNGSNIPAPGKSMNSSITMIPESEIEVRPGEEFDFPVNIQQNVELGAVSLVLLYPADQLTVLDVKIKQGNILFNTVGDELRIAWSQIEPLSLSATDPLITVRMKATGIFSSTNEISIKTTGESELADGSGNPIPEITLTSPRLKSYNNPGSSTNLLESIMISPNPVKNLMNLSYTLTDSANVRVDLISLSGQTVQSQSYNEILPGNHLHKLDVSELSEGVYFVAIKAEGKNKVISKTLRLVIGK